MLFVKKIQRLYINFKEKGLRILGFPCNQFGAQEPGDESEIKSFCETKYQITFDMFEKIAVNGDQAHPLFKFLTSELRGVVGTKSIKWNFTKFLIGCDGTPLFRFAPTDEIKKIEAHIESTLP